MAPDLVTVRCQVCDTQFSFSLAVLVSMRMPSVFCDRCFKTYDFLTLRQWYKLDMLAMQVAAYSPPSR